MSQPEIAKVLAEQLIGAAVIEGLDICGKRASE